MPKLRFKSVMSVQGDVVLTMKDLTPLSVSSHFAAAFGGSGGVFSTSCLFTCELRFGVFWLFLYCC